MAPSYCGAPGWSPGSGGTRERLQPRRGSGVESTPVARRELSHRALPGALAGGAGGGGAELAAQLRRRGELQQRAGDVVGVGAAEQAGVAVLDQGCRAAL